MFVDPTGASFVFWFLPMMEPLIRFTDILWSLIKKAVEEAIVLPIAQTIYGEAGGRYKYDDWQDGMLAVATIISNRKKNNDYPDDFISVCTAPNQFYGYARGKDAYENKKCDEIMWNYAMSIAWDMVENGGVMHPALNSEYIYLHSAEHGDQETINKIKAKPETLIFGGNMFYINYG